MSIIIIFGATGIIRQGYNNFRHAESNHKYTCGWPNLSPQDTYAYY